MDKQLIAATYTPLKEDDSIYPEIQESIDNHWND